MIARRFFRLFVASTMRFFPLRLPATAARRRPPELAYAAGERPPAASLLLLAAQHAGTTMAFIAYVLVAARLAGLDRLGTQAMVAMTLLGMALCTALQAWGGRVGSGALLVHMPNPFMIPFVAALVAAHGPGGVASAALVYGVVALGMAPLVRHLRPLFPPTVVGVVICMGGMALVSTSVRQMLNVGAGQWQVDGASALVGGATLAAIVLLSVWGGRRLRLMALLAAMALGVLIAAALGRLEGGQALAGVPLVDLPRISRPVIRLDAGMLVALCLVAVLSHLDTLGSVIMLDKMDNADWKRADMQAIAGGIKANGIGDLVVGMLGAFPTATCSANIALAYATRSTARVIGLATAALLALVAFLPQLTLALTLIPEPVLGAVGLYAAGFLIVSGMELIVSRAMDSRTIFAVGLSLAAGVALMEMPQLAQQLPEGLRFLLGNPFVVTGILVIALNLLFRLGTAQRANAALDAASPALHADIVAFVEARGAAWGARRSAVQVAALAAVEAAEAIAGGGRHVTGIRGSFDEFNLDLELLHSGAPLPLAGAQAAPPVAADLLEGDDGALDAALAQVSGRLLHHLADRVGSGETDGQSWLRLHFQH